MAKKQNACGTILHVDYTDPAVIPGTSYEQVGLIYSITPSAREREEADGAELGDCGLDIPIPGREAQAEMTFIQYWHPNDTDHEKIDAQFDSKKDAAWKIEFPHDSPTHYDEFLGYVRRIGPESLEPTGVYRREVIIRRTSAITRATTGP